MTTTPSPTPSMRTAWLSLDYIWLELLWPDLTCQPSCEGIPFHMCTVMGQLQKLSPQSTITHCRRACHALSVCSRKMSTCCAPRF